MSPSRGGLWVPGHPLAKGTAKALASVLFAATTEPRVRALRSSSCRSRSSRPRRSWSGTDVVAAEMRRMCGSRASRGDSGAVGGSGGAGGLAWGVVHPVPPSAASGSTSRCCRGVCRAAPLRARFTREPASVAEALVPPGRNRQFSRRWCCHDDAGPPTGSFIPIPDGHPAPSVSTHVHPGERVALLGPNGGQDDARPTNGILRAGAGTVAVSGLLVRDDTAGDPAAGSA